LLNLASIILVLIFVNVKTLIMLFRTGPRATYLVLAGDLVPEGTTLVTPVSDAYIIHKPSNNNFAPVKS